jgi:hypothetical protein
MCFDGIYSDGDKIKLGQAGQDLKDIRGHLKVTCY